MKLKNTQEMKSLSSQLKQQGKTIAVLSGSFDLLHAGHLHLINEAKKQADFLVVGLNSDKSCMQYKDKRGPLVKQEHRAEMLCALENVDYVVMFDEPTPVEFIKQVEPDVYCNGSEYGENCIEAETVKQLGGKLHIINKTDEKNLSTSALIEKIIARYANKKIKAVFLDRDGVLNIDKGYVHKVEDFEFVKGIIDLLQHLKTLGYKFFIITNQSGIARDMYSVQDMHKFHDHLIKRFREHGIEFEDIYYCAHHPEKEICDCRKPGFVNWQKAKKEHNVDLSQSWSIGDKLSDCIAGKKAGTKTILLGPDTDSRYVDYCVDQLSEIKSIIMKEFQ